MEQTSQRTTNLLSSVPPQTCTRGGDCARNARRRVGVSGAGGSRVSRLTAPSQTSMAVVLVVTTVPTAPDFIDGPVLKI